VARIFNTYGPRMRADDGRVVSNVICQALAGDDITVYGDGSQTRSFCYVSDLVDGFMRLMAYDESFPGAVNLGNPVELTVGDLAEKVLTMTGSSSRIVTRPLPVDDPRRRRPDISLAKKLLGWSPRTSLDAGLRATIAWFAEDQSDDNKAARKVATLGNAVSAGRV
jgi:UDP-glucuronate decarboxylase